jgi:hypothetical protein
MKKYALIMAIMVAALGLTACSHEDGSVGVFAEPGQVPWGDTTAGSGGGDKTGDENGISSGGQPGTQGSGSGSGSGSTPGQTYTVLTTITEELYDNSSTPPTLEETIIYTIDYDDEGRIAVIDVVPQQKGAKRYTMEYENGLLKTKKLVDVLQAYTSSVFNYEYDLSGKLLAYEQIEYDNLNNLLKKTRTIYTYPGGDVRDGEKFDEMNNHTKLRDLKGTFTKSSPVSLSSCNPGGLKCETWSVDIQNEKLFMIVKKVTNGPLVSWQDPSQFFYDSHTKPEKLVGSTINIDPVTQAQTLIEERLISKPLYNNDGLLVSETLSSKSPSDPDFIIRKKRTFGYGQAVAPVKTFAPLTKPMSDFISRDWTLLYADDPAMYFTYVPFIH